ncbi:MAG: hypothetical protein ACKO66_02810, partial [Flavobacteriales bacterium]
LWLFQATYAAKKRPAMMRKIIDRYFTLHHWAYWMDNEQLVFHASIPMQGLQEALIVRLLIEEPTSLVRISIEVDRTLTESQGEEALNLTAHFNQIIQFGCLRRNIETNRLHFTAQFGIMDSLVHEENFHMMLNRQLNKCYDLAWCMEEVFDRGEDPAVAIGELLRKQNQPEDNA